MRGPAPVVVTALHELGCQFEGWSIPVEDRLSATCRPCIIPYQRVLMPFASHQISWLKRDRLHPLNHALSFKLGLELWLLATNRGVSI